MAKRRTSGRISDDKLGRYGAAVLLGFVVIGGALVLGSVFFGGGHDSRPPAALAPIPAPSSELPSTAAPTGTPTAAATGALSAESMSAFLTSYLKTVAESPAEGWIMLTPDFQDASGGFAKYTKFWGRVELATPAKVLADPATGMVSYVVSYVYADGTKGSDQTRITLTSAGDKILIAGEG